MKRDTWRSFTPAPQSYPVRCGEGLYIHIARPVQPPIVPDRIIVIDDKPCQVISNY